MKEISKFDTSKIDGIKADPTHTSTSIGADEKEAPEKTPTVTCKALSEKQVRDALDEASRRYSKDVDRYKDTVAIYSAERYDSGSPVAYAWDREVLSESEYVAKKTGDHINEGRQMKATGIFCALASLALEGVCLMHAYKAHKTGKSFSLLGTLGFAAAEVSATYGMIGGVAAIMSGNEGIAEAPKKALKSAKEILDCVEDGDSRNIVVYTKR